jgi:hypothetical protein
MTKPKLAEHETAPSTTSFRTELASFVTFQTHVLKVLGSNLDAYIGHPEISMVFLSPSRLRPLPPKLFPIYNPSIPLHQRNINFRYETKARD